MAGPEIKPDITSPHTRMLDLMTSECVNIYGLVTTPLDQLKERMARKVKEGKNPSFDDACMTWADDFIKYDAYCRQLPEDKWEGTICRQITYYRKRITGEIPFNKPAPVEVARLDEDYCHGANGIALDATPKDIAANKKAAPDCKGVLIKAYRLRRACLVLDGTPDKPVHDADPLCMDTLNEAIGRQRQAPDKTVRCSELDCIKDELTGDKAYDDGVLEACDLFISEGLKVYRELEEEKNDAPAGKK
jgi:hypothetical protein